MIECPRCHTWNAEAERACLACGGRLGAAGETSSALPSRPLTPPLSVTSTSGVAPRSASRCPAGHPIDPQWKRCPYCARGATPTHELDPLPRGATRHDRAPRAAFTAAVATVVPQVERSRPTRLEVPATSAGSRRTVLGSAPAFGVADASPVEAVRPLVGVLVAPHLGPAGAVFALRAGKNAIGAAVDNDVVLAGDGQVSAEHAVVLHRADVCFVSDRLSTNGTWVNDLLIPAGESVALADRDRLRCGDTRLIFLALPIEERASEAHRT